jgi:mannose-6-phosphate isomerase-like protein (cupin superfamily)
MTSERREMGMETVAHGPSDGQVVILMGAEIRIRVGGDETDGSFGFAEVTAPPQWGGPPPHVHHAHDETFYVVEGEYEFKVGDRTVKAGPGSFVFVPREVAHAFSNPGQSAAKLACVVSPAGYEKYFEDVARVMPAQGPPDPQAIYGVMQKYETDPASLP